MRSSAKRPLKMDGNVSPDKPVLEHGSTDDEPSSASWVDGWSGPSRQICACVPVSRCWRRLRSNLYAAVLTASTGCASGKRQLPFRISRRGRYSRTM
jgi:hypothetical protein